MSDNRKFLSARSGEKPIVAITPCLEVILSVRIGDNPSLISAFWSHLTGEVRQKVQYATSNLPSDNSFCAATEWHWKDFRHAFEVICRGVSKERSVAWTTKALVDVASPEDLAQYSCSCSLGWASPASARGVSLRITVPEGYSWLKLAVLAEELSREWPHLWRSITIGYRFTPVSMHSGSWPDALSIIQALSKRFRAVDIGDPLDLLTSTWQTRLRTVGWVTLVSPPLLNQLEDRGALEPVDTSLFEMRRVGEARLFQAGRQPILGDTNRNEEVSVYRAVDHILKGIRAHEGIHLPPADPASTKAWLNRWNTV